MTALWSVAGVCLVLWIGLLSLRGGFWRVAPRLDAAARGSVHERAASALERSRSVAAVIPARNEADILPETLPTVVAQEYGGAFHVTLVDDQSTDATSAVAEAGAEVTGCSDRLTVLHGEPLPTGWAGKVWALAQGSQRGAPTDSDYLWFTDADIAHDAGVLRALVGKAESEDLDLVSVMARLRVDSCWDRLLIPAFVYFFAKLYPFRFVGSPHRRTAGAAGGCVLVRRRVLEQSGGIEAIRSALIDDCALGRLIKRGGGRVWLGFTSSVRSVRPYGSLRSIWDMVARSAYDQLRYSPPLLVGTVLGMALLYAVPPLATLGGLVAAALGVPGAAWLAVIGGISWGLMAASFLPILDHHDAGRWPAVLLPLAGSLYAAMVMSSAWRHYTGRGGSWKGRTRGAADAASS
ncbi:MAG: glycosyltransferase [Candidatus Bipolaricaulis sp.]|nr:glycosyltransferase [Candidatus Bipolaricaulis sp.]